MSVGLCRQYLDAIELIIAKGFPLPLGSVVLNEQKLQEGIDKIRNAIPRDVEEAMNIIKNKDQIMELAENKAREIVAESKQRAELMLNESELLNAVQAEAEKIREQVIAECESMKRQAQEEANAIRSTAVSESIAVREGADKYAESVLISLDKDLIDLHNIVRNGQKHLAKIKAESIANMANNQPKIQSEQVSQLVQAANKEQY